MKKILIISDNEFLIEEIRNIIEKKKLNENFNFVFRYSASNQSFIKKYQGNDWFKPINIKKEVDDIIDNYNMIISAHCKQLFPSKLVNNVKCINIHPGYNPYNRGWYPQVFSIINGKPAGATIHEIDEQLDHGHIIARQKIDIKIYDTSLTVYKKVQQVELKLFEENIEKILYQSYTSFPPEHEGNINLVKDFKNLCHLNLDKNDTLKNHLNLLRALTHGEYDNAYFIDDEGNKIYVKISFKKVLKNEK